MANEAKNERKELIDLIDRGKQQGRRERKKKKVIIAVVFLVVAATILTTATILLALQRINWFVFLIALFYSLVIGVVGFSFFAKDKKYVDLSMPSETYRDLIENGERIDAHVESIDEVALNRYAITCAADYAGEKRKFISPIVNMPPMPFEERKIGVFIDKQNPERYLVNIYSCLPRIENRVLEDRSELRREPARSGRNDIIVLVVINAIMTSSPATIGLALLAMKIWIPALIALAFPMSGWALVFFAYLLEREDEKIWKNGYYVMATAISYETALTRKGDSTIVMRFRYVEPKTKRAHLFSEYVPCEAGKLLDKKVRIYLDPDDTSRYQVDIQGALRGEGFSASKEA